MLRASRWSRWAFFCSTALMLLLLVGCGGGEGGQDQQQEEQDQAAEETTAQEAIQEITSQEEQTEEELAPVTKVTADRQYAGRVEGTDAFVGIAVRDQTNELIAYVCDGPPQGPPEEATIEAWFQGTIENAEASLTADGGEERLQAILMADAVPGTFTGTDGQTHTFVAEPVDLEGGAGLFWSEPIEGEGLSSRDGTIVLPDGEERGKRDRYITVLR